MKAKIIAALLACLAVSPAWAKWVWVAQNIRGTTIYIDPDTMDTTGQYRKAWELHNFKSLTPEGVHSMRIRKEYDCKEEKQKMHYYYAYASPMAEGTASGKVEGGSDWTPVSGNPGAKVLFRFVCDR